MFHVVLLLRSTYWTFITVGTVCHRPGEHAGCAEDVLVITLSGVPYYHVTATGMMKPLFSH